MATASRRQFFRAGLAGLVGFVAASKLAWAVPTPVKRWSAVEHMQKAWHDYVRGTGAQHTPKTMLVSSRLAGIFRRELPALEYRMNMSGPLVADNRFVWASNIRDTGLVFKTCRVFECPSISDWVIGFDGKLSEDSTRYEFTTPPTLVNNPRYLGILNV